MLACWLLMPPPPTRCAAARPHHVEVPEDAIREELAELASRRDQLKHMIHAETCRLGTVRSGRTAPGDHSPSRRPQSRGRSRPTKRCWSWFARASICKARSAPAQDHQGHRSTNRHMACIALVPELGHIDNRAAAALIGVAPFVRKSGTMTAPARIHGGRAAVRSILYMAAVSPPAGTTRCCGRSTNGSSPRANRPKSP